MKKEALQSEAEGALMEAGLRKTAQRLAILNILNSADCPLTANHIFQRLGSPQKINKVTVYRILSSYYPERDDPGVRIQAGDSLL